MVELRARPFNRPGDVSFTLEIGVLVPEVLALSFSVEPLTAPAAHDSQIQLNAGALLENTPTLEFDGSPGRRQIWWKLQSPDELAGLCEEIRAIIRNRVEPFIQQFQTPDSVADFLVRHPRHLPSQPQQRIFEALFHSLDGNTAEASNRLLRIEHDSPFWATTARLARERIDSDLRQGQ